MNNFKLGIQLYTVRNELEKDFCGTLEFLAGLGIEGVEFAFCYGDHEAPETADIVSGLGLETYGIYERIDNIIDTGNKVYSYASALNCKYLASGFSWGELQDNFEQCLKKLKNASQAAKSKGLSLCYHAHSYEFAKYDSKSYLEIILNETDLLFEADTAWIHAGGENVKDYLYKYQDKIPLIHLKDITADIKYTELGCGVINFKEVIDFASSSQVQWLGYEQDFSETGAKESTEKSINFIKTLFQRYS